MKAWKMAFTELARNSTAHVALLLWGGRGSACFWNHCFALASEALTGVVKEVLFKVVKVTVESRLWRSGWGVLCCAH